MNMMPCSFDQNERFSASLRGRSIAEIWESEAFDRFRGILSDACPDCSDRNLCMGGCPIVPQINLCPKMKQI